MASCRRLPANSPLSGKLVFSSIGYQGQEIEVNGNLNTEVQMTASAAKLNVANSVSTDQQEQVEKYPYLPSMLRYKDVFWAAVAIFTDGRAEISGR